MFIRKNKLYALAALILLFSCKIELNKSQQTGWIRAGKLLNSVKSKQLACTSFDSEFKLASSTKKDSLTMQSYINNQTGHTIKFTYYYLTEPREDDPPGLNVYTYKECKVEVDGMLVELDSTLLEPSSYYGATTTTPISILPEPKDFNGKIKKITHNGCDYLLIQATVLSCNGTHCPTYVIALVDFINKTPKLRVFDLQQTYPFGYFKDLGLYDFNKNGFVEVLMFNVDDDDSPNVKADAKLIEITKNKTYTLPSRDSALFSYSFLQGHQKDIVFLKKSNIK